MLWQLAVCVALLLQYPSYSVQQCPSEGGNAVEMKFYRAQSSEFTSENGITDVAVKILTKANSYCAMQSSECDLLGGYNTTNQFKDIHVQTVSGYPQDDLKDMLHKVYLNDPENDTCAVKKSFLAEIIERAREDIHDATGYWITYIDDEFYGIPPPTKLNQIIIPIAFAVLAFMIILTLILYKLSVRREAAERRERILRERKKKSKKPDIKPYTTDTTAPKAGHEMTTPGTERVKPKRKDQLYKENLRKSTLSKKTASIASEDSAIKVDESTRHRHGYSYDNQGASGYDGDDDLQNRNQYNHLKPIEKSTLDDTDTSEKKKKKKKKKSKSKDADEVNDEYLEGLKARSLDQEYQYTD